MTELSLTGSASERPVLVIGASGLDMVGMLREQARSGEANPATIRVSFGGVGRNVAENLARLGQPVKLITAVGTDSTGERLLAYTSDCGVSVEGCLRSKNAPTGSYLAIFDPDGARYLVLEDMQILAELTPAYLRECKAMITSAALVFIDANLPPPVLKLVFQIAKKAGIPVCADATSVLLAGRLLPYLENMYMVSANSAEATLLCENHLPINDQASALQAARQLVNQGVELAVITLAEFGAVYATSETSGHVPAVSTPVLDPTGAGDALTATVIFGILNDIPVDESVRLGVTAASLILRHRGTVLPGLSLEKLYDELVV